ncbi:mitochondrial import inner membrane translocase subunit TIM50-A-like [Paramacrobiotus metropolitanus]|uniref:mitochondrial import inner membrane translocase subunit TIM50-A-like n=1 Tax=Paramacrobiotus metropolitanus TaxID=2943436 RepID=UPI002445C923|nr:mitochondrial import inner membrane translocase subunit TIM50-A-like [Paramacrobiotus metropolitanus]
MALAGKTVLTKKLANVIRQKANILASCDQSRNWNTIPSTSRHISCFSGPLYDWHSGSENRKHYCSSGRHQFSPWISGAQIASLKTWSTSLAQESDTKKLADQILNKTVQSQTNDSASKDLPNPSQSSSAEEEEKRRKDAFARRAMKWSLIAMGCTFVGAAGFAILEWGQPQKDEDGNLVIDEFSTMPVWKQYLLRSWKEMVFFEKMIKEPSREKLLPDPFKEPYHQPPYTLVLEMTGVLVHPDWTYATGWRFKKRPGVEYFLEQLAGPYFEIVVYTSEQAFTAYPILFSLDPNGCILYKLFRDSTRYINGKHIKDLSYLNRDLSKVIVVDCDPAVVTPHTRNAVLLPKWTGNDDDRTLLELATFLKTIAASEVDDVREVLDNYRDEDDILSAFRTRQKILMEEQSKAAAALSHAQEEKDKRGMLSNFAPSLFRRK